MARTPRHGAPRGTLISLSEAISTRKCRLCRCDLPLKRKNAWCGKACVNRWFILSGSVSDIRRALKKRDKEVCQICGLDCKLLKRIVNKVLDKAFLLTLFGWSKGKIKNPSLWEADHIIPLVEGGTHELTNLRTVCIPCHAKETHGLTKRRTSGR